MSQIGAIGGPAGLGVEINPQDDLKSDFLELLVTQMRNQDPFSPSDGGAMIEQLATFSNLEQLQGINTRLDQQSQYSQSLSNQLMTNLVGKRVTVLGNEVNLDEGEPSRTVLRTVSAGAGSAEIRDEAGNLVRTIENVRVEPGFTTLEWDGKGDDGEALPDGDYTVSVRITSPQGSPVEVAIFSSGIVETIQFDNNFNTVIVNGRGYSPAAIVEVGVPAGTGEDVNEEADHDPGSSGLLELAGEMARRATLFR